MSSFFPFRNPGLIVPPYTTRPGRFSRPKARREPGIFLSQPGTATNPSYHWAFITVSMESAMISLDCKEYFIPSVPIEIPSLTPMVLNMSPTMRFSAFYPFLDQLRQIVQMHIARVSFPPHAHDADLGTLHVLFLEADAVQHGLGGPPGRAAPSPAG